MKRKVTVILVDRANYGRMRPVMRSIEEDSRLELSLICSGTMPLEKHGRAVDVVREDGFAVDFVLYNEVDGARPESMAKSIGLSILDFTSVLQHLRPDVVLLIGDRFEALAAAIATSYLNIALAHIQGGEVSGSIDETARHVITKLANLHFPATSRAKDYIVRMGEDPSNVHNVGCPVGDALIGMQFSDARDELCTYGINVDEPYLLVIYHPTTTEFERESENTQTMVRALSALGVQVLWLWPNIDAGNDLIAKVLRRVIASGEGGWLHVAKNLRPEKFHDVLNNAACAVGNSSSFVRDSTFLGTPVVLVGGRQQGREVGNNAVVVGVDEKAIETAVRRQLAHGKYKQDTLYGRGDASQRIVDRLASFNHEPQKILHYIWEERPR